MSSTVIFKAPPRPQPTPLEQINPYSWLEAQARKKVEGMSEAQYRMAQYYRYINDYIKRLPPAYNPPDSNALYPNKDAFDSLVKSWYTDDKIPPAFPPVMRGEELTNLKGDEKSMYTMDLQKLSDIWVQVSSRFKKLVKAAKNEETNNQTIKDSAPRDIYIMLLNSINDFLPNYWYQW